MLSVESPLANAEITTTGTGTHDPSPYLSVGPGLPHFVAAHVDADEKCRSPALDFREWLGGEVKINQYCRDLAIRGGKRFAEILETEEMDKTPNRELTLNMVRPHLLRQRISLRFVNRLM